MLPLSSPVSAGGTGRCSRMPGLHRPIDFDKAPKVIFPVSAVVQPLPPRKAPARGSNQRRCITNKPVGGRRKERIPGGICRAREELKINTDNKALSKQKATISNNRGLPARGGRCSASCTPALPTKAPVESGGTGTPMHIAVGPRGHRAL